MSNTHSFTVAQLVLTLNFGGLEYLVIQLCEHLEKRGIKSLIIALTDGVLIDEARQRGIETMALRKQNGFDFRAVLKLRKIIREHRVDILHTHNFAPLVHGTLAAKTTGIRTLNTRHGPAPLSTYRFIWALNDFVIPVSEDSKRELVKRNTVSDEKIRVVLNGIDLSPYSGAGPSTNALRHEFAVPDGTKLIGNFSRLEPEKDQSTLLRAFRKLVDDGINARLVIAGGGSLESELKRLTTELNLTSVVHFLGFRKGIPDLLRSIDLYVVSSTVEGLSLSIVQAMAAGLPVVATDIGGNPEAVAHGETGFIVESVNPDALAAAMKQVLVDPETARAFGERGRERAYQLFALERMAGSYAGLYDELMAKHRG